MLKNAPILAIVAVHTAENEPLKNLEVVQFNIHSPPYATSATASAGKGKGKGAARETTE